MDQLEEAKMPEGSGTTIGKCLTFAEIEGLLAAERERCAAVARDPDKWILARWSGLPTCLAIATAILNLPPQSEGSD